MNNLAHKMTNGLEADVREFAVTLYNEQKAFLFKVPEAMQQTPCDFFGHTKTGRAILMECKQVDRRRLPLGTSNGLAPHQLRALLQAEACGVIALVLWRRGEQTVVMRADELSELAEGKKSIPWREPLFDWRGRIRDMLSV